jgi:phosphate butyryltransferase
MLRSFREITEEAKKLGPKKITIACADDEVSIEACRDAKKEGLVVPILIGERKKIIAKGGEEFEIIDAVGDEAILKAVEMTRIGEADIVMKGHTSTSKFLTGVLDKDRGLRTERTLSHIAVIESKFYQKLLLLTDGGMNIKPDIKTKMDIIMNAVELAKKLGIERPKVAIVTAVETVNEKLTETIDAAILAKAGERKQLANCEIDGPLGMDLAVSPESVRIKGIKSTVAGDADILIVPDISCGNISAKALLYLGGAKIAGFIAGALKPCVMLSRSDTRETKLNSIALGIIASVR